MMPRKIQKQTTRLLKAVCPKCSYTIRLTRKWMEKGLPLCPVDGEAFVLDLKERDNS